MAGFWQKLSTKDNREFLFTLYRVGSLDRALLPATGVIAILNTRHMAEEAEVGLASDHIAITLHGHSPAPLTPADWEAAALIEQALTGAPDK